MLMAVRMDFGGLSVEDGEIKQTKATEW